MGCSVNWRFINSGVAGTSHRAINLPCQDSCFVDVVSTQGDEEVLIGVASDGAGSAAKAEVSSELVCTGLFIEAESWLKSQHSIKNLTSEIIQDWIRAVRKNLEHKAKEECLPFRDYSSTVLLAIIGDTESVFAQIGDGAIVISDEEQYIVVFWPENGEYANMTYFITDEDFESHIQVKRISTSPLELAILTDGLQLVALKYETKTAYPPFFTPMFRRLRNEPPGMSHNLCDALAVFLDSPALNERTDDDKTLLLASRRSS